jgi:hypothetical protein
MLFHSPLTGTLGVFAIMAGLAFPLHHLTKDRSEEPTNPAPTIAAAQQATVPTLVRVKLLTAARSVVVKDAEGGVLLTLENPPAGESEQDVDLPLCGGSRCELLVEADFSSGEVETALFLTLMPDGMEPATRYLIGSGQVTEDMRFQWPSISSPP